MVDRDIRNVTALGVEIRANERVASLQELRGRGYNAVFVSVGAPSPKKLGIENEDHPDVASGIDLLAMVNRKIKVDLAGKSVLVIGGGNVAIDVARTARRLGASRVRMMCLEKREEMPAAREEIHDALSEGVKIVNSLGPKRIVVEAGRLAGGWKRSSARPFSTPPANSPPNSGPDRKNCFPQTRSSWPSARSH